MMTRFAFLLAASALATTLTPAQALAQSHDHHSMPMPMPMPEQSLAAPEAPPMDHAQMNHGSMGQMPMEGDKAADHGSMDHGGTAMDGALGVYPMAREASGTAWQPDTSKHDGIHVMSGDWTLMAHGELNLVYDWQGGPRGDDKTFASGMLMGMARRSVGDGTLQFKAMVSPDPLMGKRGYPLLLASGETADGVDHLVDRQHPHDFFMELSASLSQPIGKNASVFVYGGLPGEPAFGPSAFMHRQSINASPEAPISHHWLDSTHISFGVLTAGLVVGDAKVEVSRFNGREPDQHRWNIETGPLDSTSVRVSWNPIKELALQGSWGKFKSPEQLDPGVDQKRWSASAAYTRNFGTAWWSTTLAWGRKTVEHHTDDAYVLESSLGWNDWTLFGRAEKTANRELTDDHVAYEVGKVSLGAVRDFRIAPNLKLGLGGLYAFNFVPDALKPLYGGDPNGAMAFVRLKLD